MYCGITRLQCPEVPDKKLIQDDLLQYVLDKSDFEAVDNIPLDKSLLAEGVLDSFGIIEIVEYIESNWNITIEDSEFTLERMGSVEKMVQLIFDKQ